VVVQTRQHAEQARRDAWREYEHAPSVREKGSRVCAEAQVTLCYLSWDGP
jgi:hypothetical protein